MKIELIDGKIFKELVEYGYNNLKLNQKTVDDLNVFPIPDGDTGSNMCLTFAGGIKEIKDKETESIGVVAKMLAEGMLLSARGNSGVILSQLFYGISLGLAGKDAVNIQEFCKALQCGAKQGYTAVSEPVEGTMLTVARVSVERVMQNLQNNIDFETFINLLLNEAQKAVNETPEQLAVLKEAGVVDSGGAGIYYIIEGFNKFLHGEFIENKVEVQDNVAEIDYSKFNEDSVLEFGYCSEVLLQLQRSKIDIDKFSLEKIREHLATFGNSIVTVQKGYVVKIHVHTFEPYKLLQYCQQFGEFLKIKIENMTLQNKEVTVQNNFEVKKVEKREHKKFGIVTVCMGEGIKNTFTEFGADVVIDGGQTNNPSTEDFINAFNEVNADTIFVLPNNSNIILTANQARDIYKVSNVVVVETKSVGDAFAILSMLDFESGNVDEIVANMKSQIAQTTTGIITKSIRDTQCNSVQINTDDYIGFVGKKMLVSTPIKFRTFTGLLEKLEAGQKEFLYVIYGKNVADAEKVLVRDYVAEKLSGIEFYEIDGGQDVYDFYVILQ